MLFGELRKLGRSIASVPLFELVSTFVLITAGIYVITQTWHTVLIFGNRAKKTSHFLVGCSG